jgi:flagellar basal body-associated protein FliL
MSEEQESVGPVQKKSSFASTLIWVGVAVMVAAVAAMVLYFLVLGPMLAQDVEPPPETDPGDKLNPNAVTVDFEQSVASVKMPENSQLPAALLSFQVSLECNNEATAALVQKNIARFTDMINEQHEFKTRAELDDPRIKAAIERTILIEANTVLKQLQPGPIDPSIKVTDVFHKRFLVTDTL